MLMEGSALCSIRITRVLEILEPGTITEPNFVPFITLSYVCTLKPLTAYPSPREHGR